MFLTIITFLIVLSLLVFVHELGHFVVARKFGVRAEEFGFGFPPRAFGIQKLKGEKIKKVAETENIEATVDDYRSAGGELEIVKETITDRITEIDQVVAYEKWKIVKGAKDPEINPDEENMSAGTIYSINWVPLGGFVKIKGENGDNAGESDSFASKPIWQRAAILSAGVTMNIFLALIVIIVGLMIGMPQSLDEGADPRAITYDRKIQVAQVMPNTPASDIGIIPGDAILSIDNQEFFNTEELQNYVNEHIGQELDYKIKREQEIVNYKITPEKMAETGKGGIGVAISEVGMVKYPWYYAIWEGFKTTFMMVWAILVAFYELFKGLILGHGVSADVAGPVGIAVLTGQVARMGVIYIMQFTAMLSINLAIINFLPLPALDGGRVLFLIIEKIKGRPVKRELEAAIHNIGFMLLMVLVLLITFRDVMKFGDKFRMLFDRIFG